jgi:hypothetical protein
MLSPEPAYYHGGAPGLRVGDVIEPRPPGDERHYLDGCPTCEARRRGETIVDDDLDPSLVYVTTNRAYARLYAGGYPRGALYRVEPLGERTASPDPVETGSLGVPRARVLAILDPVVILRPTDIRRVGRMR